MKTLILYISLSLFSSIISAQREQININDLKVLKYNKETFKKFKKTNCYNKKESYNILYIYNLYLVDSSKNVFKDEELLDNLIFIINKNNHNLPFYEAIIYIDSLKIPASYDGVSLSCNYKYHVYDKLVSYAIKKQPEFIFSISGSNINFYFALKNEKICVLFFNQEQLLIKNLDDLTKNYWNEFNLIKFHFIKLQSILNVL